ncbi:MAG: hypothetical protein EHM41_17075 [Chloroflexi bacterium]|nr:MAG: hypothetical protein EHM41_17075 [Chloroflexota bacterium]
MLYSFGSWNTIWVDGILTSYNPDGSLLSRERIQAWIDQERARFRVLVGNQGGDPQVAIISDGSQIKKYDLASGSVEDLDFLPILIEPYAPPSKGTETVYPHPLAGSLYTRMAELVFPSALAQRGGNYKAIGSEMVAGRETLVVEWSIPDGIFVERDWIDLVTGVNLKRQDFGKDGTKTLQTDDNIQRIEYDPNLSPEIFTVELVEKPLFSESSHPAAAADKDVAQTPTPIPPSDPQFGQIYFVVNDHNAPQLFRLPADCVVSEVKCPPAEVVPGYPNIDSTVTPLVWSNDGEKAALVVNDRLYIYQPGSETWLLLVRSDYFYPPVWSPDGSWLAYVSSENNIQNLIIVRPDGSEIRSLTTDRFTSEDVRIVNISWYSPDRLYFITQSRSNLKLYLVNTRGSSWDELAIPGYGLKDYTVFSPDGQRAAGIRQSGSTVSLSIASELDKEIPVIKEIFSLDESSLWPVAWSLDSRKIAFSVNNTNEPASGEVYVVDTRSQQGMKKVFRGSQVYSINWGASSDHILIEADQEGRTKLFIASIEDGTNHALSISGVNSNVDWVSPSWRP